MRIYGKNVVPDAPLEFGIEANIVKTRVIDLGIARNLECQEIGGSCLWGIDASNNTCYVDARLNDQLRDPVRVRNGFFIRGVPFSRLYLTNPAQAGLSITLFFAAENADNIQVENPSGMFNEVDLTKSNNVLESGDMNLGVGRTEVCAAENNRRVLFVTNILGGGGTVRVGRAADVTATRGTPLALGETMIISTTAAIGIWNPGPANVQIAVFRTLD
jgi:hypothetical protein